jgi:hypothetical protein
VTLWLLAEHQQARDFYAQSPVLAQRRETIHETSGQPEIRLRAPLPPRGQPPESAAEQ